MTEYGDAQLARIADALEDLVTLHEGRVAAAIEAMEPDSADGDDESITYVLRAEAARVAREASR